MKLGPKQNVCQDYNRQYTDSEYRKWVHICLQMTGSLIHIGNLNQFPMYITTLYEVNTD